jgi:hypothetical protein
VGTSLLSLSDITITRISVTPRVYEDEEGRPGIALGSLGRARGILLRSQCVDFRSLIPGGSSRASLTLFGFLFFLSLLLVSAKRCRFDSIT